MIREQVVADLVSLRVLNKETETLDLVAGTGSNPNLPDSLIVTDYEIIQRVIRDGKMSRATLGVELIDIETLGRNLPFQGLAVADVPRGSNAERAGLQALKKNPFWASIGDIIVAIDGEDVPHFDKLYEIMDRKRIGSTVVLTVRREDRLLQIFLDLTEE